MREWEGEGGSSLHKTSECQHCKGQSGKPVGGLRAVRVKGKAGTGSWQVTQGGGPQGPWGASALVIGA